MCVCVCVCVRSDLRSLLGPHRVVNHLVLIDKGDLLFVAGLLFFLLLFFLRALVDRWCPLYCCGLLHELVVCLRQDP